MSTADSLASLDDLKDLKELSVWSERLWWLQQIDTLGRHEAHDWLRDSAPAAARADAEVILAAVAKTGAAAMSLASRELRSDDRVVLAAVRLNGYALGAATAELQADRDFVLACVALDGDALAEVAPALKADKEVVLAAVAQRGLAVRHAHPDLQDDWEVLLTAVAQDVRVMRVTEWSSNRAFVFTVVRFNGLALEAASPQFRAERDVVLAAVAQNGNALQFAAPWLQADAELNTFAAKRSLFGASAHPKRRSPTRWSERSLSFEVLPEPCAAREVRQEH